MCGLTGAIFTKPQETEGSLRLVEAMTNALAHRGPDADGHWTDGRVVLGHRRLSIIDLSPSGAQPMHSACGRYVIAFNGEIYNHLELRASLETEAAVPNWKGHSDTETLLAAIATWGLPETLKRSSGMFAVALWDRTRQQLSLARDRVGEKPLYWGWAGDALVFGSELKALRQHPQCPRDVCRDALAQYLRFAYVPAPWSIHPGIFKLEPGCILTVDEAPPPKAPDTGPLRPGDRHGSISIDRYWSLNQVLEHGAATQFTSESEAIQALDVALGRAVNGQMAADVPLGAFLSGGIDSSLIVSLMQKQSSESVRTFTIGFENPTFNEAPYAEAIAKHLGTRHTELTVTEQDARDVIPQLPSLYDEPFADSSQIPTHLVCKAAREHVTVALSGDAGDELFGGYNRYFWGPRIWRKLDWMPLNSRRLLGKAISSVPISLWDRFGSLTGGRVVRPGDKAHKLATRLQNVRSMDDLYRSLVTEWSGGDLLLEGGKTQPTVLDDALPAFLDNDDASRMMAQDLRSYLPDDILCKLDRAAMGVSLETRVPFLDPSVLELSARIPRQMKIRDEQSKWILRQLLYSHVPRDLIERPKAGFGIPVGDWLRGPLKTWADDLLSAEALERDGLIASGPVRTAWEEHLSRRRDWTHKLWIILMFQAWRADIR